MLSEIAEAKGAPPPAGRAPIPRETSAIPKASTPEHAAEEAGAGDPSLISAEILRINEAFPGLSEAAVASEALSGEKRERPIQRAGR